MGPTPLACSISPRAMMPPSPSFTFSSRPRMLSFTTSPIGRSPRRPCPRPAQAMAKAARRHKHPAAIARIVRFDRHRAGRHHLTYGATPRREPAGPGRNPGTEPTRHAFQNIVRAANHLERVHEDHWTEETPGAGRPRPFSGTARLYRGSAAAICLGKRRAASIAKHGARAPEADDHQAPSSELRHPGHR